MVQCHFAYTPISPTPISPILSYRLLPLGAISPASCINNVKQLKSCTSLFSKGIVQKRNKTCAILGLEVVVGPGAAGIRLK